MTSKFKIIGLIVTVALIGCYDNSIYFDLESEEIISCNRKGYNKLSIKNMENYDLFFLESKSQLIKRVNIHSIDDDFWLEGYGELESQKVIEPNTLYSITNNTNGDAAHYEILILTDSTGKVAETSRPSCKMYNHDLEKLR